MYVNAEQIAYAKQFDVLSYLQQHDPGELIHLGGKNYCTREHDSLKITDKGWYWWSRDIGGKSALDYLMIVKNLTFPEAVMLLNGENFIQAFVKEHQPKPFVVEQEKQIEFQLPERHVDNKRVFSYLRGRGIDDEILRYCFDKCLLYEDKEHHNCVFVGYDHKIPKYANCRSSMSFSTFVGDVKGSDKRFPFRIPLAENGANTLYVFESAIDALSFLTLQKMQGEDWTKCNCLSLAGIAKRKNNGEPQLPEALKICLERNSDIRRVILCLDNDNPGQEAAKSISKGLGRYTAVIQPPEKGKDYNDFLQMQKGIYGKTKTRGHER